MVISLIKLRQEVIVSFSYVIVVKYSVFNSVLNGLELLYTVLVFQQIGLRTAPSVVRVCIAKH